MKKFILLVILTFLLISCGEDEEIDVSGLISYEGDDYQVNIPSSWNIITDNEDILPEPKNGEIKLAVSSEELKYGFSDNFLILSQDLNKDVSSTDFSILNNVGAQKEYVNYTKLEAKEIKFSDEDVSNLYIFEAKYSTETSTFKYLQTAKVCEKKGYLLTIGLSTDIKDISTYEEMLGSFICEKKED